MLTILIKYRFEDDPEDVVREYESHPYWDEKTQAICLLPSGTFRDRRIIFLEYPVTPNELMRKLEIEKSPFTGKYDEVYKKGLEEICK